MLIPLGILAASGAGVAGSYELIETITVGSGGAASVTFSNLNTYSTTYQHLQVRMVVRNGRSDPDDNTRLTFNGDSSSSYRSHLLFGNGSTVTSSTNALSYIELKVTAGNSNSSGIFSAAVIDILDAYENKNKTIRNLAGMTGSANLIFLQSALWTNTSALSSMTFTGAFGSYLQGSRFSIYGLKAS